MSLRNKIVGAEDSQKIVDIAMDNGCDVEVYEGCLQDNVIIYTGGERLLRNSPKSKYIILKEQYINSWSSGVKIIFTNDIKKLEAFRNEWEVSEAE